MPNTFRSDSVTDISQKTRTTERPLCPFYGMMGFQMRVFVDQSGNGCGLEFAHKPCSMETAGLKPCWDKCTRWNHAGNEKFLAYIMEDFIVFPKEIEPETRQLEALGKDGWQGLPIREWFVRIVGRPYP